MTSACDGRACRLRSVLCSGVTAKERMANGNDYWFAISGRQSADIRDRSGATLYCLRRRSTAGLRRGLHEWTFSREGKHPLFAVQRVRRFPCLRYAITRDGHEVLSSLPKEAPAVAG